jgi:hypothetical protein
VKPAVKPEGGPTFPDELRFEVGDRHAAADLTARLTQLEDLVQRCGDARQRVRRVVLVCELGGGQ